MSSWEFAWNDVEMAQCWLIQSLWAYYNSRAGGRQYRTARSGYRHWEIVPFPKMSVMSKKILLYSYNHLLPLRPSTLRKGKAFSSSNTGNISLSFLQAKISLCMDTWEWSDNEWADWLNICRCSIMTTIKLFWSYYHIKLTYCNAIN